MMSNFRRGQAILLQERAALLQRDWFGSLKLQMDKDQLHLCTEQLQARRTDESYKMQRERRHYQRALSRTKTLASTDRGVIQSLQNELRSMHSAAKQRNHKMCMVEVRLREQVEQLKLQIHEYQADLHFHEQQRLEGWDAQEDFRRAEECDHHLQLAADSERVHEYASDRHCNSSVRDKRKYVRQLYDGYPAETIYFSNGHVEQQVNRARGRVQIA